MIKGLAGAQLYTVRQFTQTIEGVAETLKKVAAIGYKTIQISAFGRDLDPKEVAKLVEDNGLIVAATHRGWGDFLNNLDYEIEVHKLWKCAHPAIGGLPGEYHTPDGL
ncbi:MAG: sugar phosphate isomerase/epimerase, partial [Anaerolineae bacterium]|nr:sugar phosphate isomerase/epimerase [Anaerolineae bacterium]